MASWAPPGCTIDMQDVIACASRRQNALHPPLRPMRDTSIARDQFQVNPRPPRKALPSDETRSPCAGRPELRNRRSGCSPQSAGLCSDRQPASSLILLLTGSSSGQGSDSSGTRRPPSRRSHTGPSPPQRALALVHTPQPPPAWSTAAWAPWQRWRGGRRRRPALARPCSSSRMQRQSGYAACCPSETKCGFGALWMEVWLQPMQPGVALLPLPAAAVAPCAALLACTRLLLPSKLLDCCLAST